MEYHEPQMDIFVTQVLANASIDTNHREADIQLMKEDEGAKVTAGGDINVIGTKQTLINDAEAGSTTFNLVIEADGVYAIYTQHLPAEFAATYLENADQNVEEQYVYPVRARDYVLGDTVAGAALERSRAEGASGRLPPGMQPVDTSIKAGLSTGTQVGVVMGVIVIMLGAAAYYVVAFKDQSATHTDFHGRPGVSRNTAENPEFENPLGNPDAPDASNA